MINSQNYGKVVICFQISIFELQKTAGLVEIVILYVL